MSKWDIIVNNKNNNNIHLKENIFNFKIKFKLFFSENYIKETFLNMVFYIRVLLLIYKDHW